MTGGWYDLLGLFLRWLPVPADIRTETLTVTVQETPALTVIVQKIPALNVVVQKIPTLNVVVRGS